MEIVPGIHRVDGVRGANSYVVIGEDGILLVDTGLPRSGKKIIEYVRGLGKKPHDIKYIVLTHADIDHSGGAAELKEMTGARVAIHAIDALCLAEMKWLGVKRGPLQVFFKLMARLLPFRPVKLDITLRDGVEIDGFTVVYTPGHTRGSICLYRPREVIFVGDALRSDSSGNPKAPLARASYDIVRAMVSLKMISELEFNILLPGHGAPVLGNASNKVKSLLQSQGLPLMNPRPDHSRRN